MTHPSVIAARRYSDVHPGFQLVAAVDAAVPFSLLTLDLLVQERRPLPIVDEFVLRLCQQGVDTLPDIAAILGMDEDTIRGAVAQQLSAETLDYRLASPAGGHGVRTIKLTAAGTRAVTDLATSTPQRTEQLYAFDRLLWTTTSRPKGELVSRHQVISSGMVILPSAKTHDVTTQEITPRGLNQLLAASAQGDPHNAHPTPRWVAKSVDVLSVEAVSRQVPRFLPAVLLVFVGIDFDDLRLSMVVDDLASEQHDQALQTVGGAEHLGITVSPPLGEPELPEQLRTQRVPYDAVRSLQRRADNPPPNLAVSIVDQDDSGVVDDSATARAELDALTVRSVPTFEHRELLDQAVTHIRHRFLLIAPILRSAIVDGIIDKLDVLLRRPGMTARIGYGLGHNVRDHDRSALDRLTSLANRHQNLTVSELGNSHPHVLIFDDTWINTNFDWLSFQGGPTRNYRGEEGTLIRATDVVDDQYHHYTLVIDNAM